MQLLAHQVAMGHRDRLRSALPDAPVIPDAPRGRPAVRLRAQLASALHAAADRLDPHAGPA
jgi:hypothetical protein